MFTGGIIDILLRKAKQLYEHRRFESIHYECRRCGQSLSHARIVCPTCGSDEIATIPL